MTERRIKRGLALLLTLCLAIPLSIALADGDDAAAMAAYWRIVDGGATGILARAMDGDDTLRLAELKNVTAEELLAFAAENRLPLSMARHGYYTALADCLAAELPYMSPSDTNTTLSLFLSMRTNWRDAAANAERRGIRRALTEEDVHAYAAETGLPAGFLVWLLLDDEWYEADWEDGDDWREGRRSWEISDWVDVSDLREKYGRDAVVTEDDVERVLRQNGYRYDD